MYSVNSYRFVEVLLGVALGTGHLTSLRFISKVGFSEICFLLVIVLLSIRHLNQVFSFSESRGESAMRLYLLSTFMLIAPVVTFVVSSFTDYNSSPLHIVSFFMSILLVFLIINARNNGFDFKRVVFWFALSFLLLNLITLYVYPIENPRFDGFRYTGGANNPNQIIYYAQSLSLLVVVFYRWLALLVVPLIMFITLQAKSDAYALSLVISGVCYLLFRTIYISKIKFMSNLVMYVIPLGIVLLIAVTKFSHELVDLWYFAGGEARGNLYLNALKVISDLPIASITGYGYGTFSGKSYPFEGTEAHSNVFDLAMQFGLVFLVVIYYIFVKGVAVVANKGDYLVASFMIAYLVTGLFHYTARHFVFWVEFSVFYYYVFYSSTSMRERLVRI